jgi:alpha-N-acetylglucosaminidase
MLILDLASTNNEQYTRTDSYFGQPFIYNNLINFGGNYVLYDKVKTINTGVFEARQLPNSTMVGTGFTPEGLGNTYIGTEFLRNRLHSLLNCMFDAVSTKKTLCHTAAGLTIAI